MRLTRHAERRCRQRGITGDRLSALLENADVDHPIGGDCHVLMVSHERSRTIKGGERLRFAAICTAAGEVVTVFHLHGSKATRYLRAA